MDQERTSSERAEPGPKAKYIKGYEPEVKKPLTGVSRQSNGRTANRRWRSHAGRSPETRTFSAAKKGIGHPYVWGGTSPSGCDCSGFVKWAHAKAGVKLPRVKQWTVMKRTAKPKPGDLVVQNGGSHVGIYTGYGKMISALTPALGTRSHPVSWMPAKFYTLT